MSDIMYGLKNTTIPTEDPTRELIFHCTWLMSGETIQNGDDSWPAREEATRRIQEWLIKHGYVIDNHACRDCGNKPIDYSDHWVAVCWDCYESRTEGTT